MIRRVWLVAIVALLVGGGIVAVIATMGDKGPGSESTASPSVSASASEQVTESASPSPSPSEAPPSPHASPQPTATSEPEALIPGAAAVVTLASGDAGKGVVLVGGFVSGVMEDGGTCTFTVTAKDTGATTTFDSTGAFNVDSTTCGSHEVATPTSKTGSYSVTLGYSNATGAVKSSPVPVEGS